MVTEQGIIIKITENYNVFTFHRRLTSFWNVLVLRPSFLQKINGMRYCVSDCKLYTTLIHLKMCCCNAATQIQM
jgi:hypothetical protein